MFRLNEYRRLLASLSFTILFAFMPLKATAAGVITLPIEVMDPVSTTKTVTVNIPASASLAGSLQLWMQIHGLEYDSQASVRVNNGSWIAISNQNITVQGLGAAYGGIGGGYHTLPLSVALPAGLIHSGDNTVTFSFNQTDGISSGFRVLAFNVQTPSGSNLVSSSQFIQDNPSNWTAPSNSTTDIVNGQWLWHNAQLKQPNGGGSSGTLRAHCADCHTQDGRDLKYFNYSNNSIYKRALFHGLNSTQANQIVTYIRTLDAPAPAQARPWNPPYQPGPGLDNRSVTEWAAGAGLNAVLGSDAAMLRQIGLNLAASDFNPSDYLNERETQIAMQLPDWNHWLPTIHPIDAWGSTFTNNSFSQDYPALRLLLGVSDGNAYKNAQEKFGYWVSDQIPFLSDRAGQFSNPTTAAQTRALHSGALWRQMKQWELMQEFQLEGLAHSIYPSNSDSRAWPNQGAFYTSAGLNSIPDNSPGIGNGQQSTSLYEAFIWYELQVILNNGGNGTQNGPYPVDWPYMLGRVWEVNQFAPQSMMHMSLAVKALQNSKQWMGGPDQGGTGWSYHMNDISLLVNPVYDSMWRDVSSNTRAEMQDAYAQAWLSEVRQFTPQQFYANGDASPNDAPNTSGVPGGSFADKFSFALPRLHYTGVSSSTINALASWAHTVWPNIDWSKLASESCTAGNPGSYICN